MADDAPKPEGVRPDGRIDWTRLHVWQIQWVRDLLLIFTIVGIIWLGYRLSVVTVPLLVALALAYIVEPTVKWMERRRIASRQGAALFIIVFGALLVVLPVTLGLGYAAAQGVKLASSITARVDELVASVNNPEDEGLRERLPADSWRRIRDYVVEQERLRKLAETNALNSDIEGPPPPEARPSDMYNAAMWVAKQLEKNWQAIGTRALQAGGGAIGGAFAVVRSVGGTLFGVFLTAFFFYFFCTGWGRVLAAWQQLIPPGSHHRLVFLLGRMDRVIAGFVRGRVIVCLCLTTVYTLGYWAVGVPAPFLVGPFTGILTLIPYAAGFSSPVAMLMMWLDPGGADWQNQWWWIIGGPLLVLGIAQFLDDWILTPMIQGKATNMDVPTVLFASIAGGSLAGIYGLLVAIPVAACIKILLEEVLWPRVREWIQGRAKDPLPGPKT
jgi:predicted PurR-regulated permease PerM